jgi:hypothetical protein
LNQREYCELHGLPLKRFGNWRAKFKNEQTMVPEGLHWRGGGPSEGPPTAIYRRFDAGRRTLPDECTAE